MSAPPAAMAFARRKNPLAAAVDRCVRDRNAVQGTAVISLEKIRLPARIGNALVSYVDYLGETFWPANLAVFYPHPLDTLPLWKPVVALLILLGITAAVLVRWRRNPYLPVGWFWYVGMLVPAIGLVQIGVHAMADRYMYLPQIGLCIALTWGALQVSRPWPHRTLACGALHRCWSLRWQSVHSSRRAIARNSEALWTHAIACTSPNSLAHTNLGGGLADGGDSTRRSSSTRRPWRSILKTPRVIRCSATL